MMFPKWMVATLVLVAMSIRFVVSTGKGPIGIHVISSQYILVADSLFDALLIIDIKWGGVVGHLVLHDRRADPAPSSGSVSATARLSWMNPTGVSTCDLCYNLYLTSTHMSHFSRIRLEEPLKSMAKKHDFSSFSRSIIEPRPWSLISEDLEAIDDNNNDDDSNRQDDDDKIDDDDDNSNHRDIDPTSKIRMITSKRDGVASYVAQMDAGIIKFHPHQESGVGQNIKLFVSKDQIGGLEPSGCTLTLDERHLVVTGAGSVYIINVRDPNADGGIRHINAEAYCGTSNDVQMHFRDAVLVENDTVLYLIGHERGAGQTGNPGMTLYKLSGKKFHTCHAIAGNSDLPEGWLDGYGDAVQFSRPHSMALTPNGKGLVITDIDNRAIRYANLVHGEEFGHITTIPYDENLWERLYGAKAGPDLLEDVFDDEVQFLPSPTHGITAKDAAKKCASSDFGGRLCTSRELRSFLQKQDHHNDHNNDIMRTLSGKPIQVWTSQTCRGCWRHHPSVCPTPVENESASLRNNAAWGTDHLMVATMSKKQKISMECNPRERLLDAEIACCGGRKEESR